MDSEFKTFIFDEESFRDSAGLFGFANICVLIDFLLWMKKVFMGTRLMLR